MRYFPLFFDLEGRTAIVVGGGEDGLRKVRLLSKTAARIVVIAASSIMNSPPTPESNG